MKVILREGFDFIPEWNDNKKQKPEEQIKVHFKFLSGADLVETIDSDGKIDQAKEWDLVCTGIDNLDINGILVTPEGIRTIKGLSPLFVELKLAYKEESAFDKKKVE